MTTFLPRRYTATAVLVTNPLGGDFAIAATLAVLSASFTKAASGVFFAAFSI